MCLLVIAWQAHPHYRLVVAANRDEFHERPTAALAKWTGTAAAAGDIVGGRDLRAAGTWLAMNRGRSFGVVTNFRELQRPAPGAPSRGELIPAFLSGTASPEEFLRTLEPRAADYSGFNLLLADEDCLWYASNRAPQFARRLPPGVYGLSNEFLDTPWPKLRRVRRKFDAWLKADAAGSDPREAATMLFGILADTTQAGIAEALPQTGLSAEWEQLLSAPFVCNPDYGTRCSTVVLSGPAGEVFLAERRFDPHGAASGETRLTIEAGKWI